MTNKEYLNSIHSYILPWLIVLVVCIVNITLLSFFFDEEKLAHIWWTIPFGGAIAAVVINMSQLVVSHKNKYL